MKLFPHMISQSISNDIFYILFFIGPQSQACFAIAPKSIRHSQYAFIHPICIASVQQPLVAAAYLSYSTLLKATDS